MSIGNQQVFDIVDVLLRRKLLLSKDPTSDILEVLTENEVSLMSNIETPDDLHTALVAFDTGCMYLEGKFENE